MRELPVLEDIRTIVDRHFGREVFDEWLTEKLSDAWDEGFSDSTSYTHRLAEWNRRQRNGGRWPEPEQPPNPYS